MFKVVHFNALYSSLKMLPVPKSNYFNDTSTAPVIIIHSSSSLNLFFYDFFKPILFRIESGTYSNNM